MHTIPSPLLYDAALRGDLNTVLAELAAGVSPDTPCTEGCLAGQTPLMAALFHEKVDAARALLAAGASIPPLPLPASLLAPAPSISMAAKQMPCCSCC